jgi:hypothetical protein
VIQQVGVKFSSATFNYIAEIPRVNTWNWNMPFALAKPAIDNDIDVTLEVNNSLITDYNTQNKTTYLPVSGDFKPVNLTMAKTASSVNGTLSLADAPSLTAGNYLVPLEIKSVTGTDGAAADNAAKVCYYRIRVYDKETGSESVSVNYTGAAVSTAAEAALGTKQTNRSGYSVEVRDAVTYLIKSPAGTAYPAINMVTNGTGYAYFTSTNANTLNVVIDLGKEVNNISGFELNCYGPTYSPKSYEVSYATEAQFRQGKEIAVGALEDCKQYVYAGISPSVSARYIILRNVTPTQTSGTRYFIWTQFYVYIQN